MRGLYLRSAGNGKNHRPASRIARDQCTWPTISLRSRVALIALDSLRRQFSLELLIGFCEQGVQLDAALPRDGRRFSEPFGSVECVAVTRLPGLVTCHRGEHPVERVACSLLGINRFLEQRQRALILSGPIEKCSKSTALPGIGISSVAQLPGDGDDFGVAAAWVLSERASWIGRAGSVPSPEFSLSAGMLTPPERTVYLRVFPFRTGRLARRPGGSHRELTRGLSLSLARNRNPRHHRQW
jgi:hypothetical protein